MRLLTGRSCRPGLQIEPSCWCLLAGYGSAKGLLLKGFLFARVSTEQCRLELEVGHVAKLRPGPLLAAWLGWPTAPAEGAVARREVDWAATGAVRRVALPRRLDEAVDRRDVP